MVPDAIEVETELESVSYVLSQDHSTLPTSAQILLLVGLFSAPVISLAVGFYGLIALGLLGLGVYRVFPSQRAQVNQIQVEPSGLLLDMDTDGRVSRVLFEQITTIEVFAFEGGVCDLCIERFDADGVMLGVSLQPEDAAWLQERLLAHWQEWRERAASEGHDVSEAVQPSADLRALQSLVVDSVKETP